MFDTKAVKEMALEYKKDRNPATFAKIVKRVDGLLISLVNRERARYRYLWDVELQELYHTAMLGLAKALISIPEDEIHDKVQARIVAYVRSEIKSFYRHLRKEEEIKKEGVPVSREGIEDFVLDKLSNEEIMIDVCCKLMNEGKISGLDLYLINQRVVKSRGLTSLAEELKMSEHGVNWRVKRILVLFQQELDDIY